MESIWKPKHTLSCHHMTVFIYRMPQAGVLELVTIACEFLQVKTLYVCMRACALSHAPSSMVLSQNPIYQKKLQVTNPTLTLPGPVTELVRISQLKHILSHLHIPVALAHSNNYRRTQSGEVTLAIICKAIFPLVQL